MHRRSLFVLAGVACAIASFAVAPAAQAADRLQGQRELFMTERFTPTSVRADLTRGPRPYDLWTLRGEREGYQLVLFNATGSTKSLNARLTDMSSNLKQQLASGRIAVEYLRVGHVTLPQGSKGLGTRPGKYADPLPPLRPKASGGMLTVPNGTWGGVAALFRVRTDAATGTYGANLELVDSRGTVYARQWTTLTVRDARLGGVAKPLLQPGEKGSFKTVMGVEGDAFWLANKAMRQGLFEGYPSQPDRMAQLGGLMSFFDSRGITPLDFPFAAPGKTGSYGSCSFDIKPGVAPSPYSFIGQLMNRYFAPARDVAPGTRQFPVRMFPYRTLGCKPESHTSWYEPTENRGGDGRVKQDDYLRANARSFWSNAARTWRGQNLWGSQTYVKNPFDEPGDATPAQRRTMNTQVPLANTQLHRVLGKKAKVVLAGWPRQGGKYRKCRRFAGGQRCTFVSRDNFSNQKMWNGIGLDEVDVWMPPFSRLYGRTTPPKLRINYRVNRDREYADRLNRIKRLRGGREVWAYNFFTATKTMPQVSIDAPGTDPRLQYWILAKEGHTGVYMSNAMLGWGPTSRHPGSSLRRKGDPYDQALYFKHSVYGYAAGWGTIVYPGYVPSLGLNSEADRNSTSSKPVSSLRLEAMRDGQEDANLIAMYRSRYGKARFNARLNPIVPNRYRNLPASLGNVRFPAYNNGNLAQRMEIQRRMMIDQLSR